MDTLSALVFLVSSNVAMPPVDIHRMCGRYNDKMPVIAANACILRETAIYEDIREVWDRIPEKARAHCLRVWPSNQPNYYTGLEACLIQQAKMRQIEMLRNPNLFD